MATERVGRWGDVPPPTKGRSYGPVHVLYAPSGTGLLKRRVKAKVVSGENAYILANHGVLVLGGDAERAIFNMALLEKVALDYLLALMVDGRADKVPLPIREIAFARVLTSVEGAYGRARRCWGRRWRRVACGPRQAPDAESAGELLGLVRS